MPATVVYSQTLVGICVSMWDVTNIFKYAAAQFTAIWLSLDNNEVPRTSAFQKSFVQYLIWEAKGAGQLLLPDMRQHDTGPNPVLNNLQAVRNQMQDLGNVFEDWLAHKMADGEEALEVMARLEALVDDLHDAIVAAQQLLDTDGN
ncbi:hypothetical protein BDR06DRAFT_1013544 [Suillus hirtellus]|nr:hypothetical protein BDR06DRAFT_1013544 [Suillus hirtellus]